MKNSFAGELIEQLIDCGTTEVSLFENLDNELVALLKCGNSFTIIQNNTYTGKTTTIHFDEVETEHLKKFIQQ
jgi:hypothetical protein